MRLCRFEHRQRTAIGFYSDDMVLPLSNASRITGIDLPNSAGVTDWLPGGEFNDLRLQVEHRLSEIDATAIRDAQIAVTNGDFVDGGLTNTAAPARLLVPILQPGKLLLLAGNYGKHIEEQGGRSEERQRTFPYVFMKPPATTLTHPGDPVRIPTVSPDAIDWELELAIVIGRECHGVSEGDALSFVAGYTIVNDISDRGFRPNSQRNERPKDTFFDWLHGKWHDTFCPLGPCVLPADEVADPQQFSLTLKVNGEVEQQGSTAQMIFPVAAIIEFISSFVTLLPGDIISTGTPHGVGNAKGKFLKRGDVMEAEVAGIGVLRNPVV